MKDVTLNWKKISRFLGEVTFDNNIRGYTHEEILKLLSLATVKHRAVILTLASTGIRREALAKIKTTDIEYVDEYKLYKIKIYRKTRSEQICFTTPEAAKAIQEFVKIRDTGWQPASLRPDREHLLFGYKNQTSLSAMFRKLSIKAGIGKLYHELETDRHGQHRDEVPAVHGLRKFCITQMARAKVDTEIAKLLTGHSIGVRGRYLNYTDGDLLQEYLKAVDLLTINEENRLRRKVATLEKKDDELAQVYKRLQQVETFLERLSL
jgi:integrase